jgi:cytochrome c peroxidase
MVPLLSHICTNGRFKTLKELIEFYNDPRKIVPDAIGIYSLLAKPLGLTDFLIHLRIRDLKTTNSFWKV